MMHKICMDMSLNDEGSHISARTLRSNYRGGGGEFSFPKQYCTWFVWGDLDREQISVFDLNSDEINHSVHYVHHILEQKRK